MEKKIIIAIDGYSATGKSSTAKKVAKQLRYLYIDSGAMYRTVTWYFLRNEVEIQNSTEVQNALEKCYIQFHQDRISVNGTDVTEIIRSMDVNHHVSAVSALSIVREKLVLQQRDLSKQKGIVMDGRDIGTVVFPNADLKIFMIADLDTRVERRYQELIDKGIEEDREIIKGNLIIRDKVDSTRKDSPLKMAKDAVKMDTTNLSFQTQTEKIIQLAYAKIAE